MQPLSSAIMPLEPAFALRIVAPAPLTEALSRKVSDIWRAETQRRPHLTNGVIYSLQSHTPAELVIEPVTYSYSLALRRAPDLVAEGLTVRPLAVTGIVICPEGVVLGRRGEDVAVDVGFWELAPSGGLSRPDPLAQVLEELEEELGLGSRHLQGPPTACGLVADHESRVVDIVYQLRTAIPAAEIERIYRAAATDEYAALTIVPPGELAAFIAAHSGHILPAMPDMLRLAHLI